MPQGHGDIVQAFEQGRALAGIDRERKRGAVRALDPAGGKIDRERRLTVDGDDARLEVGT